LEQIPKLSAIYVPIGGGGLISGISIAVKSINPKIKIIGVQPENMHAMVSSVRTKRIVIMKPKKSIAEKLAMNLNPKTITFRIISKYVDYFVLVPENEIALAMKRIFLKTGNIVEGAGAIAYAASLRDKKRKGRVACIVSGGNINRDFFRKLINEAK
jgi:threonine dehydratase